MSPAPERTLSVAEAADRLGRTAQEVSDLIEEGDLRFAPALDVASIRVPESAIAEYLAHQVQ
ncbi:MAG: helix-turn-helix domain-containing protein [Acidimicrobiales bacterium]